MPHRSARLGPERWTPGYSEWQAAQSRYACEPRVTASSGLCAAEGTARATDTPAAILKIILRIALLLSCRAAEPEAARTAAPNSSCRMRKRPRGREALQGERSSWWRRIGSKGSPRWRAIARPRWRFAKRCGQSQRFVRRDELRGTDADERARVHFCIAIVAVAVRGSHVRAGAGFKRHRSRRHGKRGRRQRYPDREKEGKCPTASSPVHGRTIVRKRQ